MTTGMIVYGVICAVVANIITQICIRWRVGYGVLRIDQSNPERDVYRLEFDDLDDMPKKKRLWLKIDPNADLSQK